MSVYLDTSVIVSFFANDGFREPAERAFASLTAPAFVSDLTALEVSSAFSQLVRMQKILLADAHAAIADFDTWRATQHGPVIVSADFMAAQTFLRRFDLNLRGPDALHIAAAQRIAAPLLTFDEAMAGCARRLGVSVVTP